MVGWVTPELFVGDGGVGEVEAGDLDGSVGAA